MIEYAQVPVRDGNILLEHDKNIFLRGNYDSFPINSITYGTYITPSTVHVPSEKILKFIIDNHIEIWSASIIDEHFFDAYHKSLYEFSYNENGRKNYKSYREMKDIKINNNFDKINISSHEYVIKFPDKSVLSKYKILFR